MQFSERLVNSWFLIRSKGSIVWNLCRLYHCQMLA